jgi:hypothetical protein
MKIIKNKNSHSIKEPDCGLYLVEYDTTKNVHSLIYSILENSGKKTPIYPVPQVLDMKLK